MTLDDRCAVHSAGKRSVRTAALAAEARRAEGPRHLGRRMAHEQRPLQAESGELDDPPGAELELLGVGELCA